MQHASHMDMHTHIPDRTVRNSGASIREVWRSR